MSIIESRAHTRVGRVIIDSTCRDLTLYPNANHFMFKFTSIQRRVSKITLLNLRVPVVSGHTYVMPTLLNVQHDSFVQTVENSSWPIGSLGMIFLDNDDADTSGSYTYYKNTLNYENPGGCSMIFPNTIDFDRLDIALYARGNVSEFGVIPPVLYPLTDEDGTAAPSAANNIFMQLEIEYQNAY